MWVMELTMVVDFASQRGGHCFRDLLDGDAETGQAVHSETHLTVRPWVWSWCESAGAYLLARTFSNDFPESVVPDHSNLLGRELLPEFIIRVRQATTTASPYPWGAWHFKDEAGEGMECLSRKSH